MTRLKFDPDSTKFEKKWCFFQCLVLLEAAYKYCHLRESF